MPTPQHITCFLASRNGRWALTAASTALFLLVACNPDLLPLVPLVDALGLDVLALLLGAQLVATLPWLRMHTAQALRITGHALAGTLAGAIGGYLRALLFGMARGTVWSTRSNARNRRF
ncbi:hypothetical protein [Stenotrophomonas sp. PD6]|uniref:hypothetical protein n=1 Tax=Stenotrophomonas sp. PD6 TaxID=3368612 RepID=UPI003BA345A9